MQGGREAPERNRAPFSFDPGSIDFVLLTHAHIDHSGLIDFNRCLVPWHPLVKCVLNVHLHNIRSYDATWRLVLICSEARVTGARAR